MLDILNSFKDVYSNQNANLFEMGRHCTISILFELLHFTYEQGGILTKKPDIFNDEKLKSFKFKTFLNNWHLCYKYLGPAQLK